MKKLIIVLLLLITFTLSFNCFSQTEKATIIFNDGDSIQGYGFIKNNKIKFRVSLGSKGEFWDFESIHKIEFETLFETITYQYVKLNNASNPVLLEVVTKGEVSFYRQKNSYWVLDSDFQKKTFPHNFKTTKVTNFLKRKEDDYPSCINCGIFNKWKKRTMDFLVDCPILLQKIKSNEFREIHLKEIVEYYNDFCVEL